jgi:aquaporin rerated protein, invertebrate
MAILFCIAEIIGAILGYGLLMFLTPEDIFFLPNHPGTCMTVIHPQVSVAKGFLWEFFLTSTLMLIVSGVWDPRNRKNGDSTALRVGE